jgi:hypothetical protein
MLFLSILHDYFLWHYTRAYKEIFHVWLNFLWFIVHFFSIPQLLRSWFAPFKRIVEERKKGFDFEDFVGSLIINLMSRIVGAIMRSILILLGLVFLSITFIAGVLVQLFWIFVPMILVGGLISSVSLLII